MNTPLNKLIFFIIIGFFGVFRLAKGSEDDFYDNKNFILGFILCLICIFGITYMFYWET